MLLGHEKLETKTFTVNSELCVILICLAGEVWC